MQDFDQGQYGEDDRQEVNPPVEVESATWSPGGTLDLWVKERRVSLRTLWAVRTSGHGVPWRTGLAETSDTDRR